MRGVEIGGAAKNVLAIGCGIVLGRGLGENARAALLTRGLAELARLVAAAGGKRETAMGLSGAGDLLLAATSGQSRNSSLGEALGRGRKLAEILAERRSVAEGVESAAAVVALARRHGVEMPISQSVAAILAGGDDSVTRFFADKTRVPLGERFLPIVKRQTDRVGLAAQYHAFAGKAAGFGVVKGDDANVERYVTRKALDGLYLMIGEEEKKIRSDPVGTGSAILAKVFGGR